MKNKTIESSKYLALLLSPLFVLTACGSAVESPEQVMNKAKIAMVEIKSGEIDITASVDGNNGADDLKFEGDIEVAFDKSDEKNPKMELSVDVAGDMKSAERNLDGSLDFDLITLNKEYYVMLNELTSSDEGLKQVTPFVNLYLGKWLRIAEDFIPENVRNLQGLDDEALAKKKQLEELFQDTKLFTVTTEYGVENLNGSKVYHYGLTPNMDGFKEYITQASIIEGNELTLQEVNDAVQILSYIKEIEVYVDASDYYVLKSVLHLTGAAISGPANIEIEVVVDGSTLTRMLKLRHLKELRTLIL